MVEPGGKDQVVAQKVVWLYRRPHYAPDLAEAFSRVGWHAELVPEREMIRRLMTKESKPDMVVSNVAGVSLAEPHPPGTVTVNTLTEEQRIPLVWLMWDSLFHDPALATVEQQAGAVKLGLPVVYPMVYPNQYNLYVFTVSKEAVPYLKGAHVEHMPFGVNERRFRPMNVHQPYPTGFIGTSLIGDGLNALPLLEELGIANGVDLGDPATARTWSILADVGMSAMDRVEACEAVGAHVWGANWDRVENVTHHGMCDWATDLPLVLNSCGVNLNVSKRCFPTDIAPRLLEILACGGVCISNRLPGIEAEFGDAVWFYDSIPELQELTARLQVDGGARNEKRLIGRTIIEAKHTWEHRVKRILEVTGVV